MPYDLMHFKRPSFDRPLLLSLSEPSQSSPTKQKPLSRSRSSLLQLVAPVRRTPHLQKTLLWILVAVLVSIAFAIFRGHHRALEFVTGYIVEYSLSLDNLFVFLLIFRYFKVPLEAQETVLTYGIVGAMILRGIMIVCGKALVERFEWLAVAFGALLIYSAGKLLMEDDDEQDDLEGNHVIRFSKCLCPVTDRYCHDKFFVREGSRLLATPLTVVLVAIELSDVIFALDSVPAVLGISTDTFVIYISNILAIMGLRSLFFVLANCIGNLRFLKHALSIVLAFIGVKMICACLGYDFGIVFSLFVVAMTLLGGVVLSLVLPTSSPSNVSCSQPKVFPSQQSELTLANSV